MGEVPDGVYGTLRASAAVLRRLTAGEQQQLIDLLTGLRREETRPAPEDVDGALTNVPTEAREVLGPLLKGNKSQFWITVLLALIAIIVSHRDTNREIDQAHRDSQEQIQQAQAEAQSSEDHLHAEITRVIEAILADAGGAEASVQLTDETAGTPKLGRNEPCWCGSGNKFKRCHG